MNLPNPIKLEDQKVTQSVSKVKEVLLNFIVPLVAIGMSLLIIIFFFLPSYRKIPELNAKINQTSELKSTLEKKIETLNRLVDFSSIVAENSNLINRVLVSEDNVPTLMTQIDTIAKSSGLIVKRLTYASSENMETPTPSSGVQAKNAQPASKAPYSKVIINLGVVGNLEQLITFLKSAENSSRILDVQRFRYGVANKDNPSELDVSLVVISPYLFVESKAVTDDPIKLDISDTKFISLIDKLKEFTFYDTVVGKVNYEEDSLENIEKSQKDEKFPQGTPSIILENTRPSTTL